MNRTLLAVLAALAALVAGVGSAHAAEPQRSITLSAGHSSIVTVGLDVSAVSSGDSGVVDAQVVNNRQVLLNAKRAGTTELVLWDPQDRISTYRIEVTAAMGETVRTAGPAGAERDGSPGRIQFQVGQSRLIDLELAAARVVVTDPELADVQVITPRQILINGKKPGLTTLIIWTGEGKSAFYDLEVSVNTTLIRERLGATLAGAEIEVQAARDGVLLLGEVADLEQMNHALTIARAYADKVTNLLRVGGVQQVQLEVRIAEVSRSALRRAGVNFLSQGDKWTVGSFGRGAASVDASVIPPALASRQPFLDAFQITVGATKDLAGVISLLEAQGLSRTLASPTLVAMSGQEASFLVGGEFPVPVAQQANTVTIEFKEFGVRLRFVPTVIGRDTISMKVAPEVSDLDFTAAINLGGIAVPGLTSRKAETTVELKDGQSFAIAGLLSDRIVSQVDRVPVLGSIPILGALFRSVQYRREETELVILVAPRLAAPLPAGATPPLPGETGQFDPDNFHLFLLGALEQPARAPVAAEGPAAGPSGAVGLTK